MRAGGVLGGQSTQERSRRRTQVSVVAQRSCKASVRTQRDDCMGTGGYLCGGALRRTALAERSRVCERFGDGLLVKGCPNDFGGIVPRVRFKS